jgi:hypothetical protein
MSDRVATAAGNRVVRPVPRRCVVRAAFGSAYRKAAFTVVSRAGR